MSITVFGSGEPDWPWPWIIRLPRCEPLVSNVITPFLRSTFASALIRSAVIWPSPRSTFVTRELVSPEETSWPTVPTAVFVMVPRTIGAGRSDAMPLLLMTLPFVPGHGRYWVNEGPDWSVSPTATREPHARPPSGPAERPRPLRAWPTTIRVPTGMPWSFGCRIRTSRALTNKVAFPSWTECPDSNRITLPSPGRGISWFWAGWPISCPLITRWPNSDPSVEKEYTPFFRVVALTALMVSACTMPWSIVSCWTTDVAVDVREPSAALEWTVSTMAPVSNRFCGAWNCDTSFLYVVPALVRQEKVAGALAPDRTPPWTFANVPHALARKMASEAPARRVAAPAPPAGRPSAMRVARNRGTSNRTPLRRFVDTNMRGAPPTMRADGFDPPRRARSGPPHIKTAARRAPCRSAATNPWRRASAWTDRFPGCAATKRVTSGNGPGASPAPASWARVRTSIRPCAAPPLRRLKHRVREWLSRRAGRSPGTGRRAAAACARRPPGTPAPSECPAGPRG